MNNSTPLSGLSEAGREKLREMTENSNLFVDFLKFHGKVFKHDPSVSLEFFIQKPDTRFIATKVTTIITSHTMTSPLRREN